VGLHTSDWVSCLLAFLLFQNPNRKTHQTSPLISQQVGIFLAGREHGRTWSGWWDQSCRTCWSLQKGKSACDDAIAILCFDTTHTYQNCLLYPGVPDGGGLQSHRQGQAAMVEEEASKEKQRARHGERGGSRDHVGRSRNLTRRRDSASRSKYWRRMDQARRWKLWEMKVMLLWRQMGRGADVDDRLIKEEEEDINTSRRRPTRMVQFQQGCNGHVHVVALMWWVALYYWRMHWEISVLCCPLLFFFFCSLQTQTLALQGARERRR